MSMFQRFAFRERLNTVREIDRVTLAIIASAIAILGAIIFPKVAPAAKHGIQCTDLPAPIGGNNRSLLAQVGVGTQPLDLQISLDSSSIGLNDDLKVNVTFVNNDIGPEILFFAPTSSNPKITTDDYAVGLHFVITRVDGTQLNFNQPVSNPWTSGPGYEHSSTWANPIYLHLLGSRSRCSMSFHYNLNQEYATLYPGIGLPPGDYRIQAFYYNNNIGTTRPLNAGDPTPTATPAYTDQGVWTGSISSSEVRFTVRGP